MSEVTFSVEQYTVMQKEIERAVAEARKEFHPQNVLQNCNVTLTQGSAMNTMQDTPAPTNEAYTPGQLLLKKLLDLHPPLSVIAMALAMTNRLRQHERKYEHDDWGTRRKDIVNQQMAQAYGRLVIAMKGDTSVENIRNAAADLANYALIVADRAGSLGELANG